ncbi:hypothetical protein B0H16DRAFT_1479510 [Mycena metata]|uniref:Uncharacterized protein n=1 Tax=Mycena metata TaxID=1033252 RepID=A0AAD7MDQ6_9AGAR|nr:hypothetical protein B0H16DRAFT_1479510 [Mycena metata]
MASSVCYEAWVSLYHRPTEDCVAQILYGDGVKEGTLQQCCTLVKAVLKHAGLFTQLEDPPAQLEDPPAQSEGLLPLLLFDKILHATDPAFDRLEPEASNDRPVFSQLSQCRRDVLDKVAHNAIQSLKRPHANCAQKECLKHLAALSSSSDPGNRVQCNLFSQGHCVLTEENIGSLTWKYASRCDPAITRPQVEGVVLKPDTEGITAALAVIDYSTEWRTLLVHVCLIDLDVRNPVANQSADLKAALWQGEPKPTQLPKDPLSDLVSSFPGSQKIRRCALIQTAAESARRRGLPSSTALQLVSAKCDELCNTLPPQKIPLPCISAEDVLDLSSVSARKPEITRGNNLNLVTIEFPPSLFPLLSKHREELGLMSQQLHGIAINFPRGLPTTRL